MCHLFHIRLVFLTYRSAYCEERKLKREIFSYQAEYCTETVTRWKNKPPPFSLDVSFTFWFVSWLSHQVHYFSLATKSFKWVTQGSTIFISYRQFSLWELKTGFYLGYLHSCMICLSPDPVCCILYSSIWLCVIISLRVILSNYVPNLSITRSHRGGCYMLTRIRILIKSRCLRIHSVSRLTLTRLTHASDELYRIIWQKNYFIQNREMAEFLIGSLL